MVFKEEITLYILYREKEFRLDLIDEHNLIKTVYDYTNKTLLETQNKLQTTQLAKLNDVVDLIYKKRDLYFFGIDYSQIVAQDAQLKFVNVQKICNTAISKNKMEQQLTKIKPDDLAIFFSISGETRQLMPSFDEISKTTKTVLITGNQYSSLAKKVDIVINTNAHENVVSIASTSGRIALLSVANILYIMYAKKYVIKGR